MVQRMLIQVINYFAGKFYKCIFVLSFISLINFSHIKYGLNCVSEYSNIMCEHKKDILIKVKGVLEPFQQLADQMCERQMMPDYMRSN